MPKSTVDESGGASVLDDSLRLSQSLLVLKRNQERKITIYGGKPPYQSESTNETLGTVFLEPRGSVLTLRTKLNFTGNFSVIVTDAEGSRVSMTVDVVNGFSLYPSSRQVYPGRKVQVTPLEGDLSSYTYTLVEGADHAEVNDTGLVSIDPTAPDNTTVTVEVINKSSKEVERSFLYVREVLDSENITIGVGYDHTCIAKTNVNQSSKAIQCWGSKQHGALGHTKGLVEDQPANSVKNTEILVNLPNQAPKNIALGSDLACATYFNGGADKTKNPRVVKCWGSSSAVPNIGAGLYPNTMKDKLDEKVFFGSDGNPLNIYELGVGSSHACALLTSSSENSIIGSGNHDGEVRCWSSTGYNNGHLDWPQTSAGSSRTGVNAGFVMTLNNATKKEDETVDFTYAFGIDADVRSIENFPNYVHLLDKNFNAVDASENVASPLDNALYTFNTTKVKAKALAVGASHSCVIRNEPSPERITCWGDNSSSQVSASSHKGDIGGNLFDPDGRNRLNDDNATFNPPVPPKKIFAGVSNTCMIGINHRLYCWGGNDKRQSNPLTGASAVAPSGSLTPVIFKNGTGTELSVLSGAAGKDHTCVIVSELPDDKVGRVYCFGSNQFGQHGQGVANGQFIHTDGAYVDLGNRSTEAGDSVPYKAKKIVAGDGFSCVMLEKSSSSSSAHNVKCWGKNNQNQLGFGDKVDRYKASDSEGMVIGDGQVIDIAASHSGGVCALKINGRLNCWGSGKNGILGHENFLVGHEEGSEALTDIPYTDLGTFGLEVESIKSSLSSNCVIYKSGDTHCWGENQNNSLGLGFSGNIGDDFNELSGSGTIGTIVSSGGKKIKSIAQAKYNGCLIDDANEVRCWGYATTGLLANDLNSHVLDKKGEEAPVVEAFKSKKALKLSQGASHFCGLFENTSTSDHEVICWGRNTEGQLGRPSNSVLVGSYSRRGNENPTPIIEHIQTPVELNLGPQDKVIDLKSGSNHTCALIKQGGSFEDNYVKCWGDEKFLGVSIDPASTPPYPENQRYKATNFVTPKLNFGGENPVQLSAGAHHTCVLFDTERVKCWGQKAKGVLGWNASPAYSKVPAPSGFGYINFGPGRRATRIYGEGNTFHNCAVLDVDSDQDGRHDVKCWGWNERGQLGIGTTYDSDVTDYITLRDEDSLVRYRVD